MAGGAALKLTHQVLRALAEGPQTGIDLRRALGWSVHGQNKALDALLQRMRIAGLIESTGQRKGEWQIAEGLQVCATCLGKGVTALPENKPA